MDVAVWPRRAGPISSTKAPAPVGAVQSGRTRIPGKRSRNRRVVDGDGGVPFPGKDLSRIYVLGRRAAFDAVCTGQRPLMARRMESGPCLIAAADPQSGDDSVELRERNICPRHSAVCTQCWLL
jgi:hypothetical protein